MCSVRLSTGVQGAMVYVCFSCFQYVLQESLLDEDVCRKYCSMKTFVEYELDVLGVVARTTRVAVLTRQVQSCSIRNSSLFN